MKTSLQLLHWSPRILCIMAILFVSLFALDAFAPGYSFWKQLSGFFIHLVPSFILIACLVLAWKKELIGGILIALIGLGLSPFVFQMNYQRTQSIGVSLVIILMITFPFVIVGLFFILSYFLKKKDLQKTEL